MCTIFFLDAVKLHAVQAALVVLIKAVCVCIGDHRLSLMLSQAVGSQFCRDLLALQLSDWNRMQTDSFIEEERLRIFALLAGKPVSK